ANDPDPSEVDEALRQRADCDRDVVESPLGRETVRNLIEPVRVVDGWLLWPQYPRKDRKSTRLNSSHDQISYAVFCLKKKKVHPSRSICAAGWAVYRADDIVIGAVSAWERQLEHAPSRDAKPRAAAAERYPAASEHTT